MIRWKSFRALHKWGAAVTAIPLLLIILSGILLQFKKESSWIQPPSQTGSSTQPLISFDSLFTRVAELPETQITSWQDIDRIDVRPSRGIMKILTRDNIEIQMDSATGEILQTATRRSDIIEDIHDGSWFFSGAKLFLFFPIAVIILSLWLSGIFLLIRPWLKRQL